jgi:Cu+-exporting ATPase
MNNTPHHHSITVKGLHCASCASTVEHVIQKWGGEKININLTSHRASFEAPHESLDTLSAALQASGFSIMDAGSEAKEKKFLYLLIVSATLTVPLLASMLPGLHFLHNASLQCLLSTPVLLIGLYEFGRRAISSIAAHSPSMEVLILLGAICSYGLSLYNFISGDTHTLYFESSASIITFVLLGNFLESKALAATRSSIHSLEEAIPQNAKVLLPDGAIVEKLRRDLVVGEVIVIGPGDIIPADGKVLTGEITADESIISGESAPRLKSINDLIIEGAKVVQGGATAAVTAAGNEGTLATITSLLTEAHSKRPRIQKIGDRASAIFTPIIVTIAFLTFFVHHFYLGATSQSALITAISIIVIACPCAMGLATPAALVVGLGEAAKRGILIKNSETIEKLSRINTVYLDKTGTLTSGTINVTGVSIQDSTIEPSYLKSVVTSLERYSNHPVAKALVTWSHQAKPLHVENFKEELGSGVSGTIEGANYLLGRPRDGAEGSVALFKNDNQIVLFNLSEEIVPNAEQALQILQKEMHMFVAMLSGDSLKKCSQIQLDIPTRYAELSPEGKVALVQKGAKEFKNILFVGDGVNDAGALASASVGASVSHASGLTKDASDVVLLSGDAKRIPLLIQVGKNTMSIIKGNLFWAFSYNIIAVPLAASGILSPTIAAIVMTCSDIVVIGNSLRLKKQSLYEL